jgi:putative ABC transport system substrate-binding protein
MDRRPCVATLVAMVAAAGVAVGCGDSSDGSGSAASASTNSSGAVTGKLCVHQTSSAPTGVAVVDGIKQEVADSGDDLKIEVKNSEGDAAAIQAITEQFLRAGCSVIIPTGSQIAAGYVKREKDTPIVFGSVSAPYKLHVVDSPTEPGRNVTGIGTPIPIEAELDLLKQIMPGIKRVGMIYGASDLSGQLSAELGKAHYSKIGVTGDQVGVSNSAEITDAAQSLVNKGVEAIQVGCDSISAQGIAAMIKVADAAKIPVFGCSDLNLDDGKLFAGGYRYDDVGVATAKLAIEVLKGKDPGSIPVKDFPIAGFFVNEATAKRLGLTIPPAVVAKSPRVVPAT